MPRHELALSRYRGMWVFALFDLPVTTKRARKQYAQFRKLLLGEGFSMLQFSVYARYCGSEEFGDRYFKRIRESLPPAGEVRLLMVTDRQFGKMEVFCGKTKTAGEKPPEQLVLF